MGRASSIVHGCWSSTAGRVEWADSGSARSVRRPPSRAGTRCARTKVRQPPRRAALAEQRGMVGPSVMGFQKPLALVQDQARPDHGTGPALAEAAAQSAHAGVEGVGRPGVGRVHVGTEGVGAASGFQVQQRGQLCLAGAVRGSSDTRDGDRSQLSAPESWSRGRGRGAGGTAMGADLGSYKIFVAVSSRGVREADGEVADRGPCGPRAPLVLQQDFAV